MCLRAAQPASSYDAGSVELVEPLGEDVLAHLAKPASEVGEALRPEQQLAHDEQRPALADDVERARDPAGITVGTTFHLRSERTSLLLTV